MVAELMLAGGMLVTAAQAGWLLALVLLGAQRRPNVNPNPVETGALVVHADITWDPE